MASPQLLTRRLLSLPSSVRTQTLKAILSTRPSTKTYATYNTNFSPNASSTSNSSSVNHSEVSHFNALASEWWDPQGSSRLLHLMNPLRHRFLRQCLASHVRDTTQKLTILDVGCGGGIFAESAARSPLAESVTAIDPTPQVIAIAKKHQRTDPFLMEKGRLTYRNIAIEELELPATPGEGYDVISVFEVLEHIVSPSAFLEKVLPHLKPGGWLVGSTMARTATSWLTTKFIAEEVIRMVPRGTHDWNQYIQPSEMREWARGRPELDVTVGGQGWQSMGVVYVPGLGWKEVPGSEDWGNYFFGVRKLPQGEV